MFDRISNCSMTTHGIDEGLQGVSVRCLSDLYRQLIIEVYSVGVHFTSVGCCMTFLAIQNAL